jgi:hypothetical protein
MKASTILKIGFCICTLLAIHPSSASGQVQERCSLEQISNALNQLECEVDGAFISTESLTQSVAGVCEYTPTAETCHLCFERAQRKLGSAIRSLVFLKVLPISAPIELIEALRAVEDSTCSPKEREDPELEDGNDRLPDNNVPELNRGRNSSRDRLRSGGRPASPSGGQRRSNTRTRRGR